MKQKSFFLIIIIIFAGIFISSCQETEKQKNVKNKTKKTAYITKNNVLLRQNPTTKGKIIGKLKSGAEVTILEKTKKKHSIGKWNNYWFKIITESGNIGWSYGAFIKFNDKKIKRLTFELIKAIKKNDIEKAATLLEQGANPEGDSTNALLCLAIDNKNFKMVKLLKKYNANLKTFCGMGGAVQYAVSAEAYEIANYLIDNGAKIHNKKHVSPNELLLEGVKKSNLYQTKVAIKLGADIEARGKKISDTILMIASDKGNLEIVKYLVESGANVNARNKQGATSLMRASGAGNLKIVKYLFLKGALISTAGWGFTSLRLAVQSGNLKLVKLLIKKGDWVNAQVSYGDTVLMAAAERKNIEIVKVLLKNGAKIEMKNNRGETALMKAACHGQVNIMKLLLKKGSKINKKDFNGNTALMKACSEEEKESVKFLLKNGADFNLKNSKGKTALDIAKEYSRDKVIPILKEVGAK